MYTDTIAAIATALSDSGIGIIRVSGENAIEIVDKIYRNKEGKQILKKYLSHTIHYGFIVERDESIMDEVMVTVMKAPKSYTMEDTVEINCHGSVLMLRKILMRVIQEGARIAEPGEFTKRAFLSGRIDLSKAEAVMDLIHAKNEFALQSSVRQLKGEVSQKIIKMREEILYETAFIESALDDPEHISLDGYMERLKEKVQQILERLNYLIDTSEDGRILKEGINTVILGKPNAGKSSLLNILVGNEKAIVTDIAGTTRDTLEECVNLDGITLNIADTAGIRDTDNIVEKIGVEKAKKRSQEADLILYVVDRSVPLDKSDAEICQMIKEKPAIVIMNKSDLQEVVNESQMNDFIGKNANSHLHFIGISAKMETGIDELTKSIKEMFLHGGIKYNDEVIITNMRHKEALCDARESMLQVMNSIEMNMPEDFYSIDLVNAYKSLGKIIGEEIGDDLVNEIFSKFCMGK